MSEYQLNKPTVSSYAESLMLKTLLEQNLFKSMFRENHWRDNEVSEALGLPNELENQKDSQKIVFTLLKSRYESLQKEQLEFNNRWECAYKNIEILANLIGMNETEKKLFYFAFHLRAERALRDLFSYMPGLDLASTSQILADLLGIKSSSIRAVLNTKQKLISYGLLQRSYSPDKIDDYLSWGDTIDFDDFTTQQIDESLLLESCTFSTVMPSLSLDNFKHIADTTSMMLDYLKTTIQSKRNGVNILLYGIPGTGKTEFSALLAEELNLKSFTITYQDKDGDTLSGCRRLEKARLAQTLLKNSTALVIFDEIEDVFGSSLFERSVAQENKAWMNQLLENNQNPVIWISNSVEDMDPAFLRRFDFIFEMPNLPLADKMKLIEDKAGGKLEENQIKQLALVDSLSPAVITKNLSVLEALNVKKDEFYSSLLKQLNQYLQAQGKMQIVPLANEKLDYNLNWVNCNDDIKQISQGLIQNKQGRICCYGPAGTGKTAWANWLGQEMDMPVLSLKCSDLLDKFVGESEKKIAKAFKQAKQNNMLLILDEADTFLFGRENAEHSWELSRVNEMLTQIENFDGMLVVSTNLIDVLDSASLRRFDLKLKFDYLNDKQVYELAKQQLNKFGLSFQDSDIAKLQKLKNLALGDFATLSRRHRFAHFVTAEQWLLALENESVLKGHNNMTSSKIGF